MTFIRDITKYTPKNIIYLTKFFKQNKIENTIEHRTNLRKECEIVSISCFICGIYYQILYPNPVYWDDLKLKASLRKLLSMSEAFHKWVAKHNVSVIRNEPHSCQTVIYTVSQSCSMFHVKYVPHDGQSCYSISSLSE